MFKFITPRDLTSTDKIDYKLIQLITFDRNNFIWSCSTAKSDNNMIGYWPSLFRFGLQDIHYFCPEAPNSAYRKLQEAFWCMGIFPKYDDYCIDLGGSPGGWAALML
eukprot:UN33457